MLCLTVAAALLTTKCAPFVDDDPGHSEHGSAFDSGMRTRPWIINGIGDSPFPITTANPEVQKWFNQGYALLDSFWFEEAERSFRWCIKLEPNCAMAYWGLARCGMTWFDRWDGDLSDTKFGRYKAFLKEAVKRKAMVTEHERLYIEAWEQGFADKVSDRGHKIKSLLQAIAARYPDDVQAKALLALFSIDIDKPADTQAIIDQVLAKSPMHPGAHHASIHNWDDSDPGKAIKSCRLYGKAAPGVGHALHMPGHIYSKVGMWHEAAISMDSATRVELKYMNDRLALPYEDWDYAHNRNYLCDIQEQLGMFKASLEGARDMLAAPRDVDARGSDSRAAHEGFKALLRALVKFERWADILKPGFIPWADAEDGERKQKPLYEVLALAGEGKTAEARSRMTELMARDGKTGSLKSESMFKVSDAELLVGEGKPVDGAKELAELAKSDGFGGDPPDQPWPYNRLVGDAYLLAKEYPLAIKAYQAALVKEPNDAFSLSGLAKAYHASGNDQEGEKYADRLVYEWSGADPGLRWLTEVKALGLGKKPVGETLVPERKYDPDSLRHIGPSNWKPFSAPKLDAKGFDGTRTTLEQYRGKNVLLVFYLGNSCIHCVKQLELINSRMSEFAKENTVVLAVNSGLGADNTDPSALKDVHIKLLVDRKHDNARRFSSYDDFENLELHSTILIDAQGRIRWKRTGGDPFSDVDFLLRQVRHINASAPGS